MYNHAASAREPDGQEHMPVDQHAVGRRLLPAAAAAAAAAACGLRRRRGMRRSPRRGGCIDARGVKMSISSPVTQTTPFFPPSALTNAR